MVNLDLLVTLALADPELAMRGLLALAQDEIGAKLLKP
jgi:hypothetical protein